MEFEKIFNLYTMSVVIILLLATFLCTAIVVVSKTNSNLGVVSTPEKTSIFLQNDDTSGNCTQKQ